MPKDLIAKYIKLAPLTDLSFPADYGGWKGKINVFRNNRAVTRMYKIAKSIESDHPELKDEFARLMDRHEFGISVSVASDILDSTHYGAEAQRRALTIIEAVACDEASVSSVGTTMRLIDWYEKHPEITPNETVLRKNAINTKAGELMMEKRAANYMASASYEGFLDLYEECEKEAEAIIDGL